MPTPLEISPTEFREAGYLAEVNRRVLHPLGLAMGTKGDAFFVWDKRDDPEGVRFDPELEVGLAARRAMQVAELEAVARPVRVAALGYYVQPITEPAPDADPHPVSYLHGYAENALDVLNTQMADQVAAGGPAATVYEQIVEVVAGLRALLEHEPKIREALEIAADWIEMGAGAETETPRRDEHVADLRHIAAQMFNSPRCD